MSFRSVRKKIRGLRRKVKRIETWKENNINLNVDSLLEYGMEYIKLWISPFYNLYTINQYECGHKNPPNWFNRLILKAMFYI